MASPFLGIEPVDEPEQLGKIVERMFLDVLQVQRVHGVFPAFVHELDPIQTYYKISNRDSVLLPRSVITAKRSYREAVAQQSPG